MWVQLVIAAGAVAFALLVAVSDAGSSPSSGPLKSWHVFAYAGFTAVCFSFIMPARQALIVNTVPPADIGNAMALNSMGVTMNRLTGALVGGLLITTVGIAWNFVVEAASYIIIVLLMIPMRTPNAERSVAVRSTLVANLREGFRYVWRDNRVILHLIILASMISLIFMPLTALLPAYTSEVLHAKANVGGYLVAAQGVGGFFTTVVLASLGFGNSRGKLLLISLVGGSAAILVLAQSHWLLLSLAMMVVLGVFQTTFITLNIVLIQSMIPDTHRGRITSIYMLEQGLGPLSVILMGLFMDLYGPGRALTVEASLALGLSIVFLITFRRVRGIR
jgi:MFS family permease